MPKTELHAIVGAVTGASFYLIDRRLSEKPVDPEDLGASFMLGGLAGALPDILEPPLHRAHRRFFHSFATLAATAYSLSQVHSATDLDEKQKTLLKSSIAAYMSHLLLDSRTPVGLPLVI